MPLVLQKRAVKHYKKIRISRGSNTTLIFLAFSRFRDISDTSWALLLGLWNDIAVLQLLDRLVAVLTARAAHKPSFNAPFNWALQTSSESTVAARTFSRFIIFSSVISLLTTYSTSSLSLSKRAFCFLNTIKGGCSKGKQSLEHSKLPSRKHVQQCAQAWSRMRIPEQIGQ